MNKEKLIPELRFPEFKNDEKWTFEELEQCLDYLQPTPYLVESTDYKDEYEIPVLTAGKTFILGYTNEKEGVFRENLPVIIFDDFTTASQFVDFPFKAKSSAMKILLAKNDNNIKFVYEAIQNINYEVGVHQRHWISIFSKLKITIPKNPNEQQKIATCLSSLDEVIAAHSQKLELLKDHKKGLMQNLFPQEGEKVPKYRFKEFVNDGEWILEPFHKVYNFLVTNSFSREFLNYDNGTVKNIHYGDIHTKFSSLFDITKENVPYINPAISIERIREECYCLEGDMIFADASEDLNDVGKSIEIVNLNGEKLLSGLHTLMARQIEKKLEIGFGGHLFKTNGIRKQIQKESQGAKVLGISGTRISNIQIYYPENPKEQTKIASCLSSLDTLINAQVEKIEQLKLHKKGLMHGLFPMVKS